MDNSNVKGHDFENQVANLFRILGYQVTIRQTLASREIDIVCKKTDLPIPVTYIVECKSGKVITDDVDTFHAKLVAIRRNHPSHTFSVPVIVHQGQIVGHALEQANNVGIQCYEFADLLRKIWPVDLYLQVLDQLYQDSGIENQYVPLDGNINEDEHVSLDEYLESWLKDDQRRHIALLGDYGTGKTWICLRMAKQMADAFRDDPNNAPLPLLITFRRYQAGTDLETLIKAELSQEYNMKVFNPKALIRLLCSGNAVLILDGMDEMASKSEEKSALLSYYSLGLPAHGPKVLITCRTHYFYSGTEQKKVFNPNAELLHTDSAPTFEIVHICPFDYGKIQKCIEKRLEEHKRPKIIQMIKSTYNVRELSSRPIFLQMICESHKKLSEFQGPITSALLYENYIQNWLKREMEKSRLSLEPDEILRVVEDLAYIMVQDNTLFLDPQEMRSYLSELLKRTSLSSADCAVFERQIVTSTFFYRSLWDKWGFAHRSFQEFFYARKFFRWEEESNGTGEFPVEFIPLWQFIAQLALSRWDYAKALKWIPEKIKPLEDQKLTLTTLRAAAAYWLIKKNKGDLKDYPFTRIMLDWVDLRYAKLTSCNLMEADFTKSNLKGAFLQNTCLERSTLLSTNFEEANLSYANLKQANCQWASFLYADLTGAVLTDSQLELAQFNGAILKQATLKNATVVGADFRGANFGIEGSSDWLRIIGELRNCRDIASARFDKSVSEYL